MTRAINLPTISYMPPFSGATQWLNSPPLSAADLLGKVVLVNFWTYTCVNWLRTLPYIRAWADKYKDQGLIVIGVHTPEFAFEHNIDNVQQAIKTLQITYPVVVDNKYAIWTAFDNHYWPAFYFVDIQGHIRYQQFGEGEYEMSERVIQQLLAESETGFGSNDLVLVEPHGVELAADWDNMETPETYLGYANAWSLATPSDIVIGRRHTYEGDEVLSLNQWTLSGDWTVEEGGAVLHDAHGKIIFRYHARDLNIVMGPVMRGSSVQFRVQIDGEVPGSAHGEDSNAQGNGKATEQRLYQLIRQQDSITDRQFEIEFLDAGIEANAFTFG